MKMQRSLVLIGVAAIATAAPAQPPNGEALFVANGCYQCHGYVGQGGAGPRLAPTAYPYEAFDRLVRRPSNEMPAYAAEVLSADALRAIYAYLRSIPEPPAMADIAILR
jgi:ubiquinol-cytochrome c reductase cytochrome c subunit